MNRKELKYSIKSAIFGVVVGDALGVPVEFKSREELSQNPVVDMRGYETYNLPVGTWSDDSSMTFCLMESLIHGFDINVVAQNFIKWMDEAFWTPYGEVFDIGNGTKQAIGRLKEGVKPRLAGGADARSNGNGSLMRTLPLIFYIKDMHINERFSLTRHVSSVTHRHLRSIISCFYYMEFAKQLLEGRDKFEIYADLPITVGSFLNRISVRVVDLEPFDRLFNQNIADFPEEQISSSGYVIHTLEASIWCLLNTDSYVEAVLKAVNLGDDTDTTAAVTGGLAGLLYGFEEIPSKWINQLARLDDIKDLMERFTNKMNEE